MQAQLKFSGNEQADLFTQEIQQSFAGVLANNLIRDPSRGPVGFITASIDGRYWHDTMWSRDSGTFLRELVHYGDFKHARLVWQASVDHVALNELGYYTFPMYVYPNRPRSGEEMDGTALMAISSILLWERLAADDPFRQRIERFLLAPASPIRYILAVLDKEPFVAGAGEFGGGLGVAGRPFYNAVQNAQVAMMLDMAADRFSAGNDSGLCGQCRSASALLRANMLERMVFDDGSWIWCLDPATGERASEEILYDKGNKGFAGINGILSHACDAYGFSPLKDGSWLAAPSVTTFYKLLMEPSRLDLFARYGFYSQFDLENEGKLTSAAYGQGYAIQCALLMDQPAVYTKAIGYLTEATYRPAYAVTRETPYYFYERYLAPESEPPEGWEEGCGALNLVNVTEPLKCARLMIGVDDHSASTIHILPRLPTGWTEATATGLPVRTSGGHARIDVHIQAGPSGRICAVRAASSETLPKLKVRLGTPECPVWREAAGTDRVAFEL